ncbi:MAG: CcmD family protein [Bacteroidota bacterium]
MKNILNIILQMQTVGAADAQGTEKFYVVVGVIAVIFIGIVGYLISIDRKINKLEK